MLSAKRIQLNHMTQRALILPGSAHPLFALQLAAVSGIALATVTRYPLPNDEMYLRVEDPLLGKDVCVVQTIYQHPHRSLMELFMLLEICKRAGARKTIAVIPYLGYARQDKVDIAGTPLTAKLIAKLLETAGAQQLITMDLHAEQIQGFFDIPVYHLHSSSLIVQEIQTYYPEPLVVVGADVGAARLARHYAKILNTSFGIVDKERISFEQVESYSVIGEDLQEKTILIVDDVASTGATLIAAAQACKRKGAKKIIAVVAHALFKDATWHRISGIEKIFFTDSVVQFEEKFYHPVSVVSLFSQAIHSLLI